MKRILAGLGAALLVAATPRASAAEATRAGVRRDAVLERFVGQWRTETTVHDGAGARIAQTSGTGAGTRILQDRWVEFRTASVPPGEADLQVMTWDERVGVYRQWVFDADGYWHVAEGRWDPATATLTWRGEKDGAAIVVTDRWLDADRLHWTLTRTAPDGRVLQRIEGTLTRTE
ncbi:MAG: DUF1579 family protein [Thermodesulfobacteriota bacterium]